MNSSEFLWTEKFRPRKIDDCILPEQLKKTFRQFIDQGSIPNLLLAGGAGVGKTTVARAMLDELDADYIIINGSLNGNIDTLRNEIQQFASAVSFKGGRKYVILDEADYLNPQSTQPALRNFIEEFSKNCGFIFTCNYKNKILEPLRSRCAVVEFKIKKEDSPVLAAAFMKRVTGILKGENVSYQASTVARLISIHFPDWRRCLNELQRYGALGSIDDSVFQDTASFAVKELIPLVKAKDFLAVRKWVGENSDIDSTQFFRALYDLASEVCTSNSVPELILRIAEYQYKAAFVADQEINNVAFLLEVMINVEFKP